jgi:hypothetical protein
MLISHKHKFIMIDIPKTGTRSRRQTLLPFKIIDIIGKSEGKNFYQHGTAFDCKKGLQNIGLNFNDYFSFCVVRNPWDRYLSFFKYCKEKAEDYLKTTDFKGWRDIKIKQGKHCVNLFSNNNEQQVIRKIINNKPTQSHYFLNQNQQIMVSYIALFENIQTEFEYFCETIGIEKIKLLHNNKSETQISCSDIYNQELIDLVAEKEQCVIKLKNYQYIR